MTEPEPSDDAASAEATVRHLRERVRRLERDNEALDQQVTKLVQTEKELYETQNELDRQVGRLHLINRYALTAQRASTPEEILEAALPVLEEAYRLDEAVALLDGTSGTLRVVALRDADEDRVDLDRWAKLLPDLQGIEQVQIAPADAPSDDLVREVGRATFGDGDDDAVCVAIPLRHQDGGFVGAVVARQPDAQEMYYLDRRRLPDPGEPVLLSLLQGHIEAALQNQLLHGEVRDLADQLEDKVRERTAALEERSQELALSVSLHEATLDAIHEGVLVVDRDGRIVSYNDRFQEMWNLPDEVLDEMDDEEAMDFVLDQLEDPEAFVEKIEYLYDHPEERSRDLLRFEDGRVYERSSGPQRLGDEIVGRVWGFHDITRLKKAQEELQEYTEKLRRSNEELQQFAHVVSHDLQEPLRMVTSYMELLEDRYTEDLPDEASEFMSYASEGAERMHRLLNDLLAYARVDSRGKEPTPTDADVALDDALSNLEVAIRESDAEIRSQGLPVVLADRSQLVELFQNLIANAIKYTAEDVQPQVEIDAEPEEDRWRFEVTDNGIGIDPAHQEQIFTIFRRLHERGEYEGTGAGLAICKRIVDRHGGRIGVESEPGEGSTFWFSLPAAGDRPRHDPSHDVAEAPTQ